MTSKLTRTSDEASIVLLGAFNPAIFHPEWYLRHKLIDDDEGKEAKVEIVMNDVAIVRLPWAVIEVMRDRYTARTNDESHFDVLRDLVSGTFKLLEHTPVNQVGINRNIRFQVANTDVWHHIGHALAPKKLWQTHMKNPGLLQLTIIGQHSDDDHQVNVSVKPSSQTPPSVQVEVNNHYVLKQTRFQSVIELLQNRWEIDLSYSAQLTDQTINAAVSEVI